MQRRHNLAFAVAAATFLGTPFAAADTAPPPGSQPAAQPPAPPLERRSTGATIAGSIAVGAGGLVLMVGLPLNAIAISSSCDNEYAASAGCHDAKNTFLGIAIGGAITVAAGIALLIYGAPKVRVAPAGATAEVLPVRSPPAWVGAPGASGWSWRF